MEAKCIFVTVPGRLLIERSDGRLTETEGIRLQIINVLRGYLPFNQVSGWICAHSKYASSYKQCSICEKHFSEGDEFGIADTQWEPIIVCRSCGERFTKELKEAGE